MLSGLSSQLDGPQVNWMEAQVSIGWTLKSTEWTLSKFNRAEAIKSIF